MERTQHIENLIAHARIKEAIQGLLILCKENQSSNYQDAIVLSAQYNNIQRKERLQLGDYNHELSRIIKSLLSILEEEKKWEANEETDTQPKEWPDLEQRLLQLEDKIEHILNILRYENWEQVNELAKQYYWRNLEPESKIYLSTAEKGMLIDGIMDYSSAIIQYLKVLETEFLNKIFLPIEPKDPQELEITLSHTQILKRIINALLEKDHEEQVAVMLKKKFHIISAENLGNDLQELLNRSYRNRAAHPGILTQKEAEDCRNFTLNILANLMNRPYSATRGLG